MVQGDFTQINILVIPYFLKCFERLSFVRKFDERSFLWQVINQTPLHFFQEKLLIEGDNSFKSLVDALLPRYESNVIDLVQIFCLCNAIIRLHIYNKYFPFFTNEFR